MGPQLYVVSTHLLPYWGEPGGARPSGAPGCSGHGASAGRSVVQPCARPACAASTPTTSVGLCRPTGQDGRAHLVQVEPARRHAQLLAVARRAARRAARRDRSRARNSGTPRRCRPARASSRAARPSRRPRRSASSASSRWPRPARAARRRRPAGRPAAPTAPCRRGGGTGRTSGTRSCVVQGQHPDGARVLDELAGDGAGLAEVDVVAHDVPDHAVAGDRRTPSTGLRPTCVGEPVAHARTAARRRPAPASRCRSTSTSRLARCASTAACDQPGEQRVRPVRARAELRVRLGRRRSTGAPRAAARRTRPARRPARCRRTPARPASSCSR